jgi:hypothetical protein
MLLFSALFVWSLANSQEDTLTIQVFDWDTPSPEGWNVSYEGEAHFPDSGQWRQILMVKTLKCDERTKADSFPCGEWDYLTKTNVLVPLGDSVEAFNIYAFITPYGKRLNLGSENGWQWVVDVTDYAPILKGNRPIISGNNQELLDLKFHFIPGVPARNAISVENIYPFGEYEYAALADDSVMKAKQFILHPNAAMFRLRARIAGHGHAGPHNCCEWDNKFHTYKIGEWEQFKWNVWTDCGFNPIYPQGGTWPFDRAGWCPGTAVDVHDFELTPFVQPGDTVSIDYEIEMYRDNGEKTGKFTMSHQLFSFSAPNFHNDVMLVDIIAPSDNQAYSRINPMCSSPVIRIRNTGKMPLKQCVIYFGQQAHLDSLVWNGNLDFLETQEVVLPEINWTSTWESGEFHVRLDKPNGQTDDQPLNNVLTSTLQKPLVLPSQFVVHIETNDLGRAGENSLRITQANGELQFYREGYADDMEYNHVIDLKTGCYQFEFLDNAEDGIGLHWWNYYSDKSQVGKSGKIEIQSVDGEILKKFPYDFGEKLLLNFIVED